jgi:hypothetical protein
MERDIVERLLDFKRCGIVAGDRINLRECAAIEINNLRKRNEQLRAALTVISGSSDRLQALQARAALDNIGAKV